MIVKIHRFHCGGDINRLPRGEDKRPKMTRGQLEYTPGQRPKVGDLVYIVVDSANRPTGFWKGELTAVADEDYGGGGHCCGCTAKITDPTVDEESKNGVQFNRGTTYLGTEPDFHYRVLDAHRAVRHLRAKRSEDRREIDGLKSKVVIINDTYRMLIQSLVSPDSLKVFMAALDEFLKRINR